MECYVPLAPRTSLDPCLGLRCKSWEKKKKDVENTLKDSYPAKHSRDVSEHLKEQAAFKREFSFTELGIHAKGESAS